MKNATPALLATLLFSTAAHATNPSPHLGNVKIVARSDWDESPPRLRGVTKYPKLAFDWLVIHHSSFEEPPGPSGLKAYHQEVYGWADVGYHFIIAADGTIYEGRNLWFMGAHAGQTKEANRGVLEARKRGKSIDEGRKLDPDYGAIGIVLDGAFFDMAPNVAQQNSLRMLVSALQKRFGISWDHVVSHREVKEKAVEARHLTFAGPETICPGDALQSVVDSLRKQSQLARRRSGPVSSGP